MKRILTTYLLLAISLIMLAANDKSYYFQRAEEAYQKKDYKETLRLARAGVEENAKDGYCWAIVAEICSKRDIAEYAEALEATTQALKYLPKKDIYWIAFVHGVRGDVYYKVGDYTASRDAYLAAIHIDTRNDNYYAELADIYTCLKEYEQANEWYDKAIKASPYIPYLYTNKANNCIKAGDYKQAEQLCNMSLALNPDENDAAYDALMQIAYAKGNYAEAASYFSKAAKAGMHFSSYNIVDSLLENAAPLAKAALLKNIEEAPTSTSPWFDLGYYCHEKEQFAELLYCYLRAAEVMENAEEAAGSLALAYDYVEEYDKAIEQRLIDIKNDSTEAGNWFAAANTMMDAGKYEMAETYYAKAHELALSSEYIEEKRARNLFYAGKYDEALEQYNIALSLAETSDFPDIYCDRGNLYEAMGRHDEAVQDWRNCVSFAEMDTSIHCHWAYGISYAMLGNTQKALEQIDSLAKNAPKRLLQQAMIYSAMGDKAHTLECLEKSYANGTRTVSLHAHSLRYERYLDDPDFKALWAKYDSIRKAELAEIYARLKPADAQGDGITEIPFTRRGGVCEVKCAINGLPLYFVFDTGAADVSISSVEANFMLKNGYLTDADFLGKQNFVTATGEIHEGTIINLREVRVGEIVLTNVKASVTKSQYAPLLLGQTVFRRFGTIEVDNEKSLIRMTK